VVMFDLAAIAIGAACLACSFLLVYALDRI
jgi:hypothetical protein